MLHCNNGGKHHGDHVTKIFVGMVLSGTALPAVCSDSEGDYIGEPPLQVTESHADGASKSTVDAATDYKGDCDTDPAAPGIHKAMADPNE